MVLVAQFRRVVLQTANSLRSGKGVPLPWPDLAPEVNHRQLRLGAETPDGSDATDNLIGSVICNRGSLTLAFEFWREGHLLTHPEHVGHVCVVEVPVQEFVGILEVLWPRWTSSERAVPTATDQTGWGPDHPIIDIVSAVTSGDRFDFHTR